MAASRVTHQGEANLVRNQGTMSSIFNMEDNVSTGYSSPRPCSRVTNMSEANRQKSWGSVAQHSTSVPQGYDTTPCARVTMTSEPNYVKGQGTVGKWLNEEENLAKGYESARPCPRACPTQESRVMKEKSKGSMSEYIGQDSEYRSAPIERKIHPRGLPTGAAENAYRHTGVRAGKILQYAEVPDSGRTYERTVKPEAEHIASKHQGQPVKNLITNYGCLPLSERAPRVTVWGEDNLKLNEGGRAKTLINEQQIFRPPSSRQNAMSPAAPSWQIDSEKVYGNKVDNYNKRNATQWDQSWS